MRATGGGLTSSRPRLGRALRGLRSVVVPVVRPVVGPVLRPVLRRLPARFRRFVSAGSGPRDVPDPLLSVVVPVYQVERYLAECVDSLLAQTYPFLEILLVDDGSTDGSSAIARDYAARDPRVRVLRQDNAGLGAARNAGLDACRGDLLTFADSDDTVPLRAYERMVRTLQASGSDFVVGAYVRNEGGVEKMRRWVKTAHARRRIGVTLDEVPEILDNVVACTKVFRADFVARIGLRFPVDISYEDQVPIMRAYLQARAFDILPAIVYRWRARDERTSITQRKAEVQNLLDRVRVQRELAELLHAEASPHVLRWWYAKVFRADFVMYLKVAADADDAYWQLFQENIVSTARNAPPGLVDELELRVRVAVWLAQQGHRAALRRLVRDEGFPTSNFPVTWHDGRLLADIASVRAEGVQVPDTLMEIRSVDARPKPALGPLTWSETGRLTVRCVAPMPFVDPVLHEVTTVLSLVGPEPGQQVRFAAESRPDPGANRWARRSFEDHARSSVSGEVDLAEVVALSDEVALTRWELRAETSAVGLHASATMDVRVDDGGAGDLRSAVVDGALVTAVWSERRGLIVEVRRVFAAATGLSSAGSRAAGTPRPAGATFATWLLAPGLSSPPQLLVGDVPVRATVRPAGDPAAWDVLLPAYDDALDPLTGPLRVVALEGEPVDVIRADRWDPPGPGDGVVALRPRADGRLAVVADRPCLVVDEASTLDGVLHIAGRSRGLEDGRARLLGPRGSSAWAELRVRDAGFTLAVPLTVRAWAELATPLPTNAYALQVDAGSAVVEVLTGPSLQGGEALGSGWTVEVPADRRLVLRRRAVDRVTASRFEQQRLREGVYGPAVRGPRRDTIVFESFSGTGAGDAPRAVCDHLLRTGTDLELVWSLEDASVPVPPGTRSVLRGTADWFEAVGSASHVVTNNTLPRFFAKAPGQVHVQTWHGTPLKRIGLDIASPRISAEHHLRLLVGEAGDWDVLVSPSPYCTEIFRRAFDYQGEVLEVGRPSNDLLLSPRAGSVREQVRARLGIDEAQRVLLYAPTWRDDAVRSSGWDRVELLDHDRIVASRPDVTVLLRGHPLSASRPFLTGSSPHGGDRVLDVTSYPDLAELYLAADVLVTDYSSALFDFALTDRPVILLAPDLESYRDRVRGLYLELEEVAPGPIVTTTEGVMEALDADHDSWRDARAALRARFAPHDDGHVTERLVKALLG